MTLGATAALTFVASGAFAQNPPIIPDVIFAADSHGNGLGFAQGGFLRPLYSYISQDPGPGGNSTALTYSLDYPPSIVPGDVALIDPSNSHYDGLIRFNPGDQNTSASFVFYSAENGINSGPTSFYPNYTFSFEDSNGIAEYIPQANDPGYVDGFIVEYVFLNDAVPEPSTYAALGLGILGVAMLVLRSRRRRTFTV